MKIRKLKYYGIGSIMMGLSLTMFADQWEASSLSCSYCSAEYGITQPILHHVQRIRELFPNDETAIEITEALCEAIYTCNIIKASQKSNQEKFDQLDRLLQKIDRSLQNLHYLLTYGVLTQEQRDNLDGFKARLNQVRG